MNLMPSGAEKRVKIVDAVRVCNHGSVLNLSHTPALLILQEVTITTQLSRILLWWTPFQRPERPQPCCPEHL